MKTRSKLRDQCVIYERVIRMCARAHPSHREHYERALNEVREQYQEKPRQWNKRLGLILFSILRLDCACD